MVLCARRGADGELPLKWEFPGGKVESGEGPREALQREVDEELRCRVRVGDPVETTTYDYDFATVVLATYYCELLAGEPQATEHAELRWVPPAGLGELDWAPADIPAIARIQRDLVVGE